MIFMVAAVLLAACGQQQQQEPEGGQEGSDTAGVSQGEYGEDAGFEPEDLPPVDAELIAAPNSAFTAIEPSEVGVFGAPTVMEALEPLFGPEGAEGDSAHLSVREAGDSTIADIVRTGLADDAVTAGHVRIEFRREPDGWYPTNAYRRAQCARGPQAGQWTTELCP
jgi:hypothetical protein